MFFPLAELALTASLVLTAADRVPRLDVRPSCRGAARSGASLGRDMNSCLRQENEARARMVQQWRQFTAAEKTRCVQGSTMGGSHSYVELLTCLEMARDARKLPKERDLRPPVRRSKRR